MYLLIYNRYLKYVSSDFEWIEEVLGLRNNFIHATSRFVRLIDASDYYNVNELYNLQNYLTSCLANTNFYCNASYHREGSWCDTNNPDTL